MVDKDIEIETCIVCLYLKNDCSLKVNEE